MEIEELAQVVGDLDSFLQMPEGLDMLRQTVLKLAVTGKLTAGTEFSLGDEEFRGRLDAGLKEPVGVDLRTGWVVAPFGSLGVLARGRSKHRPRNDPALYSGGTVPLVQTGDIARSRGKVTTYTGLYNEVGVAQSRLWPSGTLCITIAANIGDTGVLQFPACFPDSVVGFVPNELLVDLRYVEIYLQTIRADLKRDAPSTAQKNINLKVLERIDVKLPSLDEQSAIAEQVAILMQLVDSFEHARDMASETRRMLSRNAFRQLGSTLDATAVENLDLVLTEFKDVRYLEMAIFDLAVSGHLVDPLDMARKGSVLVTSTADIEKATGSELATTVKVRMGVLGFKTSQATSEPPPFEIPPSWEWTTLGQLGEIGPRNQADDDAKVSFIPMAMVSDAYGVPPAFETRTWGEVKTGFTHIADGDVVFAKITPCFENSKAGVVKGLANGFGAATTELHVFRNVTGLLEPSYVYLWLKSRTFLENGAARMTGTAGQKRVPRKFFSDYPFPLPPIEEQRRIVNKVAQIMELVAGLRDLLAA